MIQSTVTFAPSLSGDGNEALRGRVRALAREAGAGPLRVDTVPAAFARLPREGEAGGGEGAPADAHLLFDLHRVVLFRPDPAEDAPHLGSVVRALVDGYPYPSLGLLLERAEAGEPFRFPHPPAALGLLPLLWRRLGEGEVAVGDLVTGEVSVGRAWTHPQARPVPWVSAETVGVEPPPPLALEPRAAGPSLRAGAPPELDGLVSPHLGPVRERVEGADPVGLASVTLRAQGDRGATPLLSYGKGILPSEAALVAACEALERHQISYQDAGEPLVFGSYDALKAHAVDPPSLFIGVSPGRPGYAAHLPMYWTWAWEVLAKRWRLVPAQEVWFDTNRPPGDRKWIVSTSSACALGGSLEEAAVFALLEAVERDSYLTAWYLRRPMRRIDPESVEMEAFQLLRRRWEAAYSDYRLHLFDATTDTGIPAVAGVAVRVSGDGPRTFHGAAARLSAEKACFTVLKDLCGFAPHLSPARRAELRRLLDEPGRVSDPEGHYGLYCMDETFDRLSFFDFDGAAAVDVREMDARSPVPLADRYDLREVLETLAARLGRAGVPVLIKDMTHRSFASLGLRCVKAVTPGLYPLWFGAGERRFAVTERLRRLSREWTGRDVADERGCNLELHPFA